MSFGEIITWPFSWLLLTLYELTANYGVAILLFGLVIKLFCAFSDEEQTQHMDIR
jgi:membrane protein insertase Oxa1/YidC/SpoIIIJ